MLAWINICDKFREVVREPIVVAYCQWWIVGVVVVACCCCQRSGCAMMQSLVTSCFRQESVIIKKSLQEHLPIVVQIK